MKYLFLIFSFLFIVKQSNACRCVDIPSAKKAYKQSDVVLSITVLEILKPIDKIDTFISKEGDTTIQRPALGYSKRVLVNKIYKGKSLSDTMIIQGNNSNCELYLQAGKSYIIYGWLRDNQIITNTCSRSRNAENNADLRYLERKIKKSKSKDV